MLTGFYDSGAADDSLFAYAPSGVHPALESLHAAQFIRQVPAER